MFIDMTNGPGTTRQNLCVTVQRGVKHGDVLSPALFNAGLELAVSRWKKQSCKTWVTRVVTWNPELNWHDNFSLAPKRRQGRH